MQPPPIRLVILLENFVDDDNRREAARLLRSIDPAWFAPELWVLSNDGKSPAPASDVPVVYLSRRTRVHPLALARLAARLWRCRPGVLYTLPGLANLWGPMIARILRVSVVAAYRNASRPSYAGVLNRCASRIIVDAAHPAGLTNGRDAVEPKLINLAASPQHIEQVLREVAQLGAPWTATDDGKIPLELPLWPPTHPALAEKIIERGRFRPDRSLRGVNTATLTVYLPAPERATGAAAVICPGGAYAALSIDKEGHDVARVLARVGVAGLVLKYRLPRPDITAGDTPWPLQDIMRALSIARAHARAWNIDPRRLGVIGFSAGGHMAAAASATDRELAFVALIYPVISMQPKLTHKGSRLALLGRRPTPDMTARYSFEDHVTNQACPTFLVHARDDDVVAVENSIVYADALRRAGVAYEFMCLPRGGHGFGIGIQDGEAGEWPKRFAAWLSGVGFR